MPLYDVVVKSYLGSDTRIQVTKNGNPKKTDPLDRNLEYETIDPARLSASTCTGGKPIKRNLVRSPRLSTYAKASLQRVGGAVAARFPPHESIFLTGTFPGGDFRSQSAVASESAWIVHRLKSWIYKKIGANVSYYVWEFQKRGTLHLHYVVLVPCARARAEIIEGFREEWIRLIAGASIRSGQNLFIGNKGRDFFLEKEKLQIYAQECYKSSAAYLSKYLSKKKYKDFPPPTRMWGASREARKLVAESLISIRFCHKTISQAEDIAYRMESESNTPQEKSRFFRHRFSQGFTILLYNDVYRIELSRIGEAHKKMAVTTYFDKAAILRREMERSGLLAYVWKHMTRVGWADFRSLIDFGSELEKEFEPEPVLLALFEVRALVNVSGVGGSRHRFDTKNRIAAIITEIIEAHGLSILQRSQPDSTSGRPPLVGDGAMESVPNPGKQLSMLGIGSDRASVHPGSGGRF